jgi:hypothetical protein
MSNCLYTPTTIVRQRTGAITGTNTSDRCAHLPRVSPALAAG